MIAKIENESEFCEYVIDYGISKKYIKIIKVDDLIVQVVRFATESLQNFVVCCLYSAT